MGVMGDRNVVPTHDAVTGMGWVARKGGTVVVQHSTALAVLRWLRQRGIRGAVLTKEPYSECCGCSCDNCVPAHDAGGGMHTNECKDRFYRGVDPSPYGEREERG